MGVSLKRKSHYFPSYTLLAKPQSVLSSLTFLAGVLTYFCLSNVWRFHSHVTHEQEQAIIVAAAAAAVGTNKRILQGRELPTLSYQQTRDRDNSIAFVHPSHAYLRQPPRPLPGLFQHDDDDNNKKKMKTMNYPTQVTWPFAASPTAVRLLFVHVGKAGGMSLYRKIQVVDAYRILKCRIRNETKLDTDPCLPEPHKKSPMLRQRVFGQLHKATAVLGPKEETWIHQNTNLLLFMMRDPLDRIVSAFNFQRHVTFIGDPTVKDATPYSPYQHRNQTIAAYFYNHCFDNIQHLAMALDPRKTTPAVNAGCADWGLRLITGQLETTHLEHFYYNYRTYAQRAITSAAQLGVPNKPWVVIRTDQLWADTGRLEGLLGGNPRRFEKAERNDYRITHGSESYQVSSGVDAHGAVALCCLLWDDVRVYTQLLLGAINLDQSEKVDTLRPVLKHCGIAQAERFTWQDFIAWSWHDWVQQTCHPTR